MKLFVKGDIDGFFALGLDNLLMLILMSSFCLGFPLFLPPELFFSQILPATAVGVLFGNVVYARMALQLAKKEGRDDVCALPYGVNLLTVFVFVFLVMFPAKLIALGQGNTEAEAAKIAWQAGIVACLGSGLIEFFGSFFINYVRRFTPRAALLSALAGIGLFFIAADFFFRAYAFPLIGMTTLAITLAIYFGRVTFKGGIPGGLVVLTVGTVIAWILYVLGKPTVVPVGSFTMEYFGLNLPRPVLGELLAGSSQFIPYLSVILPMGLINLVLSLQLLESAKAAGDDYPARPALITNGVGTLLAASLGSCFPTCLYIGHPGWKSIGSRAGYSILSGGVIALLCFSGLLTAVIYYVPVEAGMAILIWIGLMMCSQAFETVPKAHFPAVALGLLPAFGAVCATISKHTLRAAGYGSPEQPFPETLISDYVSRASFYADGMFALEAGYVYSSLILAAATVCIIERKFNAAGFWFLGAAAFSLVGMTHSYAVTSADVIASIQPAMQWVWGYLVMAGIFFAIPYVTRKEIAPEH
jgi:AGZA family xanthine/uracil permease-like MFS transporter